MFSGMNYVYEVYKEQSFSKAAENLYISQPALSSMIKKIETKIGMPLFDRSTSPIQLTECGKKYIKTAEKIMDLENEFAYYVGNLQELKTGRLSVGGTYLFSSFIFPPIIDKFRRAYPHVKLNLFEGHTPLLAQKLFAGELDIIIDNYLLDAGISDIWAKSVSKEHARILQRIGARHIINAETDAGKRVGHLVSGNYLDYIELEGAYSVVKIHTPPHVVGYSIEDARVHERFGITVVGVKSPGKEFEYGSKELIMHRNDELIIMGKQDQIDKFLRG